MKPIPKNARIDFEQEKVHVLRHLADTWSRLPRPVQLVNRVAEAARQAARGAFKTDALTLWCLEQANKRDEVMRKVLPAYCNGLAYRYDMPTLYFYEMGDAVRELQSAGEGLNGTWSYNNLVLEAYENARALMPGFARIKPDGWTQSKKDFTGHASMESFHETAAENAELAFEGHDTSSATGPSLPIRLCLPNLLYSELHQGRNASQELVGALFAHFMVLREHDNTVAMLESLGRAKFHAEDNEVVFNVKPVVSLPLAKALLRVTKMRLALTSSERSVENFKRDRERADAYQALSPAEKQRLRDEDAATVEETIDRQVSEHESYVEARDAQKALRIAEAEEILLAN